MLTALFSWAASVQRCFSVVQLIKCYVENTFGGASACWYSPHYSAKSAEKCDGLPRSHTPSCSQPLFADMHATSSALMRSPKTCVCVCACDCACVAGMTLFPAEAEMLTESPAWANSRALHFSLVSLQHSLQLCVLALWHHHKALQHVFKNLPC